MRVLPQDRTVERVGACDTTTPCWVVIRPISRADRERLRDGFEHLSDESRHRRFLVGVAALTDDELTYLSDVDHRDHEALVAIDPRTDDGIGVARYVRSAADPEQAEIAVTVADAWQDRGVGTALSRELARSAGRVGIRRFEAVMLQDNRPMLSLLEDIGTVHRTGAAQGVVEVVVDLDEDAG